MTDTCSCPPGDCHGGHTTQIGPVARLTDEQIVDLVQRWKAGESVNASRPEVNSMAAELLAARVRITELEAERDIADEFGLQSFLPEAGGSTMTIGPTTERARQLVLAMSLACGRMLDDDQAPNYVEFEVSPANHPGYVVHVRRAGGPSPHTLRKVAEARVAELEAADREHSQLIEYLHYAHGIEIDREDDDFREWQEQYGA